MNTSQEIIAMFRANYPSIYMDEATSSEIANTIKDAGINAGKDEIRKALVSCSDRNPDRAPNARQLVAEIRATRKENPEGLTDASARNFLKALEHEPDPERRWSLICHADQKQIFMGEREDGTSIWEKNRAQLFTADSEDPCRRAQRLADRHGIEYTRFKSSDNMNHISKSIAQGMMA